MLEIYSALKSRVGFLVDIIKFAQLGFQNPHGYTKFLLLKKIARKTGAKDFIETGTYKGITARRASRIFDKVITVELDEDLYRYSSNYLSDRKNVCVIHGDST